MKHAIAGVLLVLACAGCKSDPAEGPRKAWDRLHADGTRNVLVFQGRVDVLSEQAFQERLKAQLHKER